MDFRHLRYFLAVAEELSYSRASRRLRVAQPALSRAVKELEAELGLPVFERTKHFVRLTPAGNVLRQESALLFDRWEEVLQRVKRTATGEEGELRLGYIGPPTQPFLGRLLSEYKQRYPRVSIHLEERTPERVWEMVARGRLSVAITRPVLAHESSGLKTELLRNERLGVLVRDDHELAGRKSLSWKFLTKFPLIVLARREGMSLHDAMLAGCREAGFMPRLSHTPSLVGTIMSYVEAGAGVGIVTDSVGITSQSLQFIPLTPQVTVPLVLVWQQDADAPPVQRFRELLMEWKDAGKLWK